MLTKKHYSKPINFIPTPLILKKSSAILAFLLLSLTVVGQKTKLHLVLKSDNQHDTTKASLALFHLPDSTLFLKTIFDSSTQIEVSPNTNYFLLITAVNKSDFKKRLSIKNSDVFLKVEWANKTAVLSDVTVLSKRSFIKEEDDKIIVDATPLTNSSTNAYEVVEKTPGTIIDQDGNVYISSSAPATIMINGRETKLSATDLASMLKSLPANSISKIEIMRTPSAKFDASSSGGIVNIVLKKGVKIGSNGSVNAGIFQGVYSTKTMGFNFNQTGSKLSNYISYQFTNRNGFDNINSTRGFEKDSLSFAQVSSTKYPSVTHYINTGFDYNFTEKFNLGYDTRVTFTNNHNTAFNNIDIINNNSSLTIGNNQSNISNTNTSQYWTNTLNSKYKIDTAGTEWTNLVDYSYFNYRNLQNYQNDYIKPFQSFVIGDGQNNNKKNILTFQSDLVWKLPAKITVETGLKYSKSVSQNVSNYFKSNDNIVPEVDSFQTNSYRYNEKIGALYFQISKTVYGFTLKPGFRYETTNIFGNQIIPTDTSFAIKRADFFPYVFLKHDLFKIFGKSLIANAVYRKSIKRPYYESLNPFPKYVDQYLFESGNPALKPQFTTNYELNVTFNDFPVLALGINDTKDIFSQVIYQNPNTKIAYRTFDNLGKNKEYYAKLVVGIPPGKKYFFYIGTNFNYNQYSGTYQGLPLNYNRMSQNIFTFHEYKLNKSLIVNLQGFMRLKGLYNFYELENFGGMFVSLNKSFWNKKANVILSLADVLKTNHVSFNLDRNEQTIIGERYTDSHRVGLTVRYNFGIKPKEEKKETIDIPIDAKNND